MTFHAFLRGAVLIGASGLGCATTQALHTETSASAMRSAEDMGANSVPQAALHLQLAREETKTAEALNADGHAEEGASFLLRAEADAELAVALSRAEAERLEAQTAVERVRKLQAENPYAPGGAK